MPVGTLTNPAPEIVKAGASGFQYLTTDTPEGIAIITRLRETQGDVRGRAFLLDLDQIIVRLGMKWEAKEALVREHLRTNFDRRFQEPNWCAALSEDAWIALTITAGSRDGALKCAEIWQETGQFFVGDMSGTSLPLFEVLVEDANRLKLRRVDLNTYFDRDEDFGPKTEVRPQLSLRQDEPPLRKPLPVGTMTDITRPSMSVSPVVIAGRNMRVACATEPVFELRKLSMIGQRLEPMVVDITGNVHLDSKALKGMDWADREKIDLANIEEGIKLLRMRTPSQRKILMVVPIAFSTLASLRGRTKTTHEVSKAAADLGMKVLYEIRELGGVPGHRIAEIVSLIRPFCMTVVGHVAAEPRSIQAVKQCGFSGICVTYDGVDRDQPALQDYLADLSVAAKAAAGACMVQGFDNLRQMAVARLAGVSHASVKGSALLTAGGRS